jgi:hypothetical protein
MNENPNPASESAAVPQASESAQAPMNAPLAENPYVQNLFAILNDNGKDTKGLAALIGHVSEMESFVKRAEDKIADMKTQLAEMKEAQGHPVRTALQGAIKALETKVAEVKERISELKTAITDGAKSAVAAFKENGAAALGNVAKFFHIKGALKAIDKSVDRDIAICDRAVATIGKFAENYHEAGRGIKNMGLIIIGREPVDQKKENGKLAAVMSAPYKAEKAAMNGIKKAVGATLQRLEQIESAQEAKQVRRVIEKKPSVLDELDANVKMLAEQDLARPAPDRAKVKEAAL